MPKRGRPSNRTKYGSGVQPQTVIYKHDGPRDWHNNPISWADTTSWGRNDFQSNDVTRGKH